MATLTQQRKGPAPFNAEDPQYRVVFRPGEKLYKRIRVAAIERHCSLNQMCIDAITEHLDALRARQKEEKTA